MHATEKTNDVERLLKKAGSPLSASEFRDLADGVAAAPESAEPGAWAALVAPDPVSPDVRRHLVALERQIRLAGAHGLERTPAPPERLERLRAELAGRGLAGFVVPLADEHQGEFIPLRAQRLAWLTGFRGSAGVAVVLADRAAIFVDGRYTLQVRSQVDTESFEPLHISEAPPTDWIAENLPQGETLGYDPWLHTPDSVARFEAACERAGASLAPVDDNPVDAVWEDQPPPPLAPAVAHPLDFAGRGATEKREEIAGALARRRIDAAVLSAPDSIAWLLNMRGGDIANTPVALCFAIVGVDQDVSLFIDPRKITPDLERHLGDGVTVLPPGGLGGALDALGAAGKRVQADPATAASWIFDRLAAAGADIVRAADPCALPKACKNWVELDGARAAHRRDGAALTRFLAWLSREAPGGAVTEMSAVDTLFEMRSGNEHFRGVSFDTISGAGPNGAIVHYRVDAASDRPLRPGELFLVDSGAQYLDGTTDVTRTVYVSDGKPAPAEPRDRFTRVLKGHIALAMAQFPAGTSGGQLDTLARGALWAAGLDFDHGTGHGVGSYLGVHEGPARISKQGSGIALKPGMILSNEPGYYKTDAYGIRIENLIAVRPAAPIEDAEREMLEFETLTLAPIDRALIDKALMTEAEIAWLDRYHARVREELTPLVDDETAEWLLQATAPLEGR